MILNASLDTSFWNVAARIGIVPYLFDFFRIYYCHAVEREIVTTNIDETSLIYPQAMLFQVMREDGRLLQREPRQPISIYGAGEAAAIALAQEQGWKLLINDYRPLQFAQALNIGCISVPDFCLLLYAEQKITYRATQGYLRRLSPTTSPSLIKLAGQVAIEIAKERSE